MICLSIVMVLHYLYRAAVSALFSLVVLLITYCVEKLHFILLFEQIKKEKNRKKGTSRGPVSVRPSVCLSQVGVLLKWLNVGSHKQYHTIAQGL